MNTAARTLAAGTAMLAGLTFASMPAVAVANLVVDPLTKGDPGNASWALGTAGLAAVGAGLGAKLLLTGTGRPAAAGAVVGAALGVVGGLVGLPVWAAVVGG
jgi:hypothetical protein